MKGEIIRRRNVAYIRLAHKDDSELESQKQLLREYAKDNNFEIDYYYIDNGYSGTTLDRPQLIQMIRDVKSKKITDRIIIKDLARLGRKQSIINTIVNHTSKRNIKLISTNELETSMLELTGIFAQEYNKSQKQRRQMSQEYRKEKEINIVSPYKMDSKEDIEFKNKKRDFYKDK